MSSSSSSVKRTATYAPSVAAFAARFWEYALNPSVVRESGVRAMHGEAPFIKLEPGHNFELELRSSGGLTIRPVD